MDLRHGADAPSSDAARSLAWTAEIEQSTHAIRRPWFRPRRQREYACGDRSAVVIGFRGAPLFVDPATESSLLVDPAEAPRVHSTARADVVIAGALRTNGQLRFRSFYMKPALSLAVQRRAGTEPSALMTGSRVQALVAGRTPFVVPRIVDSGHHGPRRADWLLEEALAGAPITPDAHASAALELLHQLPEVWKRFGAEHAALDDEERSRAVTAFTALAQDPPDGTWPADLDRRALAGRVTALLEDTRPMTTGVRHGDPGVGNLLRLEDGRLGLVDWEYAGHGHLAHDVMKVLLSAPDPAALAASLPAPRLGAASHAMPWRRQVATAVVLFLRGWRYRRTKALRRGSEAANAHRMHRTLRTLAVLLDD
ncbi:aminoglycoside phosphotransferase family protein [Georgenia satyanarayanai]|uniref:aminoglycoside phosphotransferase family protein n=1 Tax=Georgenia satyanarayanai TaxID=860221 RepID=UPI0012646B3E|nr:aminoglycoside phosphotransferase family protein [Georgenia satyanarayanai]